MKSKERSAPHLLSWLGLFVLSGVGGLVFQIVWMRKLAIVLGSTIQSASLTSAAFMLGLGLGAYVAGTLAEKVAEPLRRFALLELSIAVLGLGTTLVIPKLPGFVIGVFGAESVLYRPGLLLMAWIVLVVPALFMGATLPLLVSGHVRRDRGFVQILSLFYAANTLGAAVGAFITDFFLVKMYGVWNTALLAAAFDLMAAMLAALATSRVFRSRANLVEKTAQELADEPPAGRLALWLLGVSGFCGLGLEIAWTRLLVFFNGTDIYAYSLVLAIYLLGIVLGSLLIARLPARWIQLRVLGVLFLFLGVLAWTSVYTLGAVGQLVGTLLSSDARFLRRILACSILILPSTVLLGAIFPLAGSLTYPSRREAAGRSVGLAYLCNTVGSVAGSLVAGFLLLPQVGLQATIQAFGSVALLAAILATASALPKFPRAFLGVGSAALLVGGWLMIPNYLNSFIYSRNGDRLLYASDDHYGSVALVDQWDPREARRNTNLLVDGYNMAGNNLEAQRYTAQLGLLPAILCDSPKKVLIVCLGLSNTLRAVESLPLVEHIDVVELSPTVVEVVSRLPEVKEILNSPKVHLNYGDGRYHLATTTQRYDMITAEPPPPTQAGIVNLYSREYYMLCARRLNSGGTVAQWLPVMQMSQFEAKTIIRAFQDVFPYAYLFQGSRLQLVLVGSHQPLIPSLERVAMSLPKANKRLLAVDLDEAEKVLGTFIAGPEELRRYTQHTPPLTDERPYLQYHDANWTPDYVFLLGAEKRAFEVTLSGDPSVAQAQQQRLALARSRVSTRNRYHWSGSPEPSLDRFLHLQWASELMRSSDSVYDEVLLGVSAEHLRELQAAPVSWEREYGLARWGYLNDDRKLLRHSLGQLEALSKTPGEQYLAAVARIVMLKDELSAAEVDALKALALRNGAPPELLTWMAQSLAGSSSGLAPTLR